MATPPSASELFSDAENPVEVADRFEHFKAELNKSLAAPKPVPSGPGWDEQQHGGAALEKALGTPEVVKALAPELVDSVRNALAEANLGKAPVSEWMTNQPVPGGLAAFDLEAPAKLLTPRPTPLRNRIPRKRGIGLAHRFKVISGFTGTGTGGVGVFHPGITEGGVNNAGGTGYQPGGSPFPTYLRGAKISYAGYDKAVNYHQFSVSDSVSWAAQYSGQGYQDVRQLSQTALLYSSMLLEERMLLGGRGTDAGFVGAIAPTVTLAPRAENTGGHTGESAITGATGSVWVQVVGHGIWGSGAITDQVSTTSISGVIDVVISNADSSAALTYDVYVGQGSSAPGAGAMWLAHSGPESVFTIQGAVPTSGTSATGAPASDTSAYATGYDGILSYCCGPEAGYVNHVNGPLSTSNPGDEFNVAFGAMFDAVKADPDEILANGFDRKQLSDTLKKASSSSYQISLINAPGTEGAHDAQLGALVTGVQNEITGKMVNVTVHPWLTQGTMPIISWTLPLPDSNVSDVFAVFNVTDYQGISWPVTQFLYETSSYWYGTALCYAPQWCGAVMGVTKV